MVAVGENPVKHDADQAGGEKEIVYSSDGLDSSKISFPPRIGNNTVVDSFGLTTATMASTTDELVSEHVTPHQAFEFFSGKLFSINNDNNHNRKETSSVHTTESPLVRLSRIQNELNELLSFVSNSSSSSSLGDKEDNETMAFDAQIQSLRNQWSLISDAYARRSAVLNSTMKSSVDRLQERGQLQADHVTTNDSAASVSLLEERLKRIELAVGAKASLSNNTSVLERLAKVENIQSKMDEKQLEQLQKRAKVIRQDLEAAAKARNKLISVGAGLGNDDSKTINALYDQLQSLSGMSEHLPMLTQRIQSLAHQHASTATWDSRLRALESLAGSFETQLVAVEVGVKNLEVSLQQNAVQMQANMELLDARMKEISKP
jgi:Dynamitin